MENKIKQRCLNFALFFSVILLSLFIFVKPVRVFAQCAQTGCDPGYTCNAINNTCVPIPNYTGGLNCAQTGCDPGYSCSPTSNTCVSIPNYTGGSAQCNNDPNLIFQNGVCLPANQVCTTGICASSSLNDLIVNIVKILLGLAGIVAVVVLVVGGFWYITSGGNEETAEKGKKAIINAMIGLVVVMLSYAIVTIIADTLTSTKFVK